MELMIEELDKYDEHEEPTERRNDDYALGLAWH